MKTGIHPEYHPVVFKDANTGAAFLTRSTSQSNQTTTWEDGKEYPLIVVEVTSDSHPFWTGAKRVLDTEGRVQKFNNKYAAFENKRKKK